MNFAIKLGVAGSEVILALGGMLLLLFGVFQKKIKVTGIKNVAIVLLLLAMIVLVVRQEHSPDLYQTLFIFDDFAVFAKVLIVFSTAVTLMLSGHFFINRNIEAWEYPVLMVFSALGMMITISSVNFISLYLGLEMQALCFYVLAAINRERVKSTEAGLKYFVLGAVASGIFLYGVSLVYGFSGSINFAGVREYLLETSGSLGLKIGLVFILVSLAFKISAVPFHMWTPDVYEGAPTPVTAFFAAAPKVSALVVLTRLTMDVFQIYTPDWQMMVALLSAASMALGATAALVQTNIKRLMAYSSIGHAGYALVGLASGTGEGIQALLIYLTIYVTMTLGAFACVLSMRNEKGYTDDINDLAGLHETNPHMAFLFALFMFSLAGIPLLAGFFAKWYIFQAAVHAGLLWLVIFGVVTSVVAAYYYIRIVKVMYFDSPAESFLADKDASRTAVMLLMGTLNSPLSLFLIGPLSVLAGSAAAAFF